MSRVDFFCKLSDRVIIEVSGTDRATFLQGLITNDVVLVEKEHIIYTLMLSPQGKFQYDFFIINAGNSWWIDIDASRADSLIQRLHLFKLHAKVDITKTDVGVWVSSKVICDGVCVQDPRLSALGYRFYSKNTELKEDSKDVYENLRLSLGIPDGVNDMVIDKSIPLEWGMDELKAISWDKGCYMGQELTARSRYVGQIRKRSFPIEFADAAGFEIGAPLCIKQEAVGELRTFTDNFGIALIRLDAIASGDLIKIANQPIKIHKPTWMK